MILLLVLSLVLLCVHVILTDSSIPKTYGVVYSDYEDECFQSPIDLVITWVDSGDPVWKQRRDHHLGNTQNNEKRLPDSENTNIEIEAAIRLALINMTFVRKIIIFTMRPQRPKCLSWLCSDKIQVVHHDQVFDGDLFNSSSIESHVHNIPGLAEHFIYSNDDFYTLHPVKKNTFFTRDGKCIFRGDRILNLGSIFAHQFAPLFKNLYPVHLYSHLHTYNEWQMTHQIDRIKSHHIRQYVHCPMAMTITECRRVIDDTYFEKVIERCRQNKFREKTDILIFQLIKTIGLQEGGTVFYEKDPIKSIYSKKIPHKVQDETTFICINEFDINKQREVELFMGLMKQYTE